MQISLPKIKILKSKLENLLLQQEWYELLLSGNFYEFERLLYNSILDLYDNICVNLIDYISKLPTFVGLQKELATQEGLKQLTSRKASIRLRTGTKISYDSFYAKGSTTSYEGNRHMSAEIWQTDITGSPMYKSLTCLHSVLCPSFEVAEQLLDYQGIEVNYERVRQTSLALASDCIEQRCSIQLAPGETLAGKRVLIGMDGGRTRTRVYQADKRGRAEKFDTPWREPKMFTITTYDEQGKFNKIEKPIYDSTFGDDETFELLATYLANLEIDKAESVQFIADGAPWIWNRVKPLLLGLGVCETKIIETLDYYHAIEHVHEMKIYFDEDKLSHFDQLKNALWLGDFEEMTRLIKEGISGVDLEEFTPYKYFKKQRYRIGYQKLRDENRPCGSGVIESGIRRIINLRFKSPSAFWYPENVEKLIFMRGVALAGRWHIMMNNLFCKT